MVARSSLSSAINTPFGPWNSSTAAIACKVSIESDKRFNSLLSKSVYYFSPSIIVVNSAHVTEPGEEILRSIAAITLLSELNIAAPTEKWPRNSLKLTSTLSIVPVIVPPVFHHCSLGTLVVSIEVSTVLACWKSFKCDKAQSTLIGESALCNLPPSYECFNEHRSLQLPQILIASSSIHIIELTMMNCKKSRVDKCIKCLIWTQTMLSFHMRHGPVDRRTGNVRHQKHVGDVGTWWLDRLPLAAT